MNDKETLMVLEGAVAALKAGYLKTTIGEKVTLKSLVSLTDAAAHELIKEYEHDIEELRKEVQS